MRIDNKRKKKATSLTMEDDQITLKVESFPVDRTVSRKNTVLLCSVSPLELD